MTGPWPAGASFGSQPDTRAAGSSRASRPRPEDATSTRSTPSQIEPSGRSVLSRQVASCGLIWSAVVPRPRHRYRTPGCPRMSLNRRRGLRPAVPYQRTRPRTTDICRSPVRPAATHATRHATPRARAHHLAVRPPHSPKARDGRPREQDRRSPDRDRRRLPVRTADEWSADPPVVGIDGRPTRPSTPHRRCRQSCRRDRVVSRHGPRGGCCRVSPPAAAAPVGPPPHRVGWPHRDCGRAADAFMALHFARTALGLPASPAVQIVKARRSAELARRG